ncbi:MAG TPA: MarR family transcriptional regulator [Flavisolibacter sp.]|nr:MarR family transcriptional regulator [Flavisolibacter sp.]
MERLDRVIFYSLDKTIKTYRQFAQKRFFEQGFDITIDQWLVLNAINEKPDITQLEIAGKVFKDTASVTRIIDLLIKKELLKRDAHSSDRRRFTLALTNEGKKLITKITAVVEKNRDIALQGITDKDLIRMKETLNHIIDNCKKVL